MKILDWCQPHWDQLRTAVEARGLGPWISKGGEDAMMAFARDLSSDEENQFDPLIRAWTMISSRIMEMSGLIPGCPLCLVQHHVDTCPNPACEVPKEAVQETIDGCCDSLLEYAREIGMVPALTA